MHPRFLDIHCAQQVGFSRLNAVASQGDLVLLASCLFRCRFFVVCVLRGSEVWLSIRCGKLDGEGGVMLARGGLIRVRGLAKEGRAAIKVEETGRCRWGGIVLLLLSVCHCPPAPVATP